MRRVRLEWNEQSRVSTLCRNWINVASLLETIKLILIKEEAVAHDG